MSEPTKVDPLRHKFNLLLPHLDERQRRLYLGAEAHALGHGGTEAVARAVGVSRRLVRVGRQEVELPPDPLQRVRRPGGGRKRVAETDLTLVTDLESLLDPATAGDLTSPLRWTCRSSPNLALALGEMGHRISATGVQRLLRSLGFRLHGRAPAREGRPHPDPDGQFRYIAELVRDHQRAGDPVLSVDARKGHVSLDADGANGRGEMVEAETVETAWVPAIEDNDTGAFAVAAVWRWWEEDGRHGHQGARRLLLCADTGGRTSCGSRAWQSSLGGLAARMGLAITVCHLPAGVRRWTSAEERLLAQVWTRWAGQSPASHQVTVDIVGAALPGVVDNHGANGPARSILDGECGAGDVVLGETVMRPHEFHGCWNYTLLPNGRG